MKLLLIYYYLFLCHSAIESPIDRIAGGKKARRDQFPFFAQLHIAFNYEGQGYDCGGSLIFRQWILTAAHCFPFSSKHIRQYAEHGWFVLVMGTNEEFGRDGTKNTIVEVFIHPKFVIKFSQNNNRITNLENDVALGRLKNPYRLNNYIQTVKLPKYNGSVTSRCLEGTIVGTGRTSFTSQGSAYVMYAKVHTKQRTAILSPIPNFKTNTVFYTEVEWYQGHALRGDSGGPYLCQDLDSVTLYGVCSAAYNSTVRNKTVVVLYESVDKHMDFILASISKAKFNVNVVLTAEPFILTVCIVISKNIGFILF